ARVQHDHALGLEAGQRPPQRAPADAQGRRPPPPAQHLARREETVEGRVGGLRGDLPRQRDGGRGGEILRPLYCTSLPWPVSSSKTYNPARKVLWRSYHLRSRTGCGVRSTGTPSLKM